MTWWQASTLGHKRNNLERKKKPDKFGFIDIKKLPLIKTHH